MAEEIEKEIDVIPEENTTEEEIAIDEFRPDDMFTDDETLYGVGDYNLSKYKEVLDFDNPEVIGVLEAEANRYKEKGFTQEQIEFILDERVEEMANEAEDNKVPSPEEIRQNLSNKLTSEEKRNYRAVHSFVSDMYTGTELEKGIDNIMGNPILVKMMNVMYKKSLSQTGNMNQSIPKRPEKQIRSMSIDEAYDTIDRAMSDGRDIKKVVKEIKNRVADKQGLQELLKIIGL